MIAILPLGLFLIAARDTYRGQRFFSTPNAMPPGFCSLSCGAYRFGADNRTDSDSPQTTARRVPHRSSPALPTMPRHGRLAPDEPKVDPFGHTGASG